MDLDEQTADGQTYGRSGRRPCYSAVSLNAAGPRQALTRTSLPSSALFASLSSP